MKALSLRQAQNCENAQGDRCRCRCNGAFHGAARMAQDTGRKFFEQLPQEDPHHLPNEEEQRLRKKGIELLGPIPAPDPGPEPAPVEELPYPTVIRRNRRTGAEQQQYRLPL
jgi:hypothetical protein